MNFKNRWQWCLIPKQIVDKDNHYKVVWLLMLIKETPYTQNLTDYFGIRVYIDSVKHIELN